MKVFVTGTRGVPNIPGGVEKHCEQLYPLLVKRGVDILLCRRSPYVKDIIPSWQGIQLLDCYAPHQKAFEAITHTFVAILKARIKSPNIVHIHAIGPALMTPLARLLGLRVVMTHHGFDYQRQKWGKLAKFFLRLGESLGCRYANEVIVISNNIAEVLQRKYQRSSNLIPNGISVPAPTFQTTYIKSLGIQSKRYALAVSRFVPEKGLHDLLEAFEGLSTDYQLVIAGDSDYEDEYSKHLKQQAATNPKVILTGYVTGQKLSQLYSHAGLFVLPSYHEGLPIALLEAMSYGLPVVVSDIAAHLEIKLDSSCYFKIGDVQALQERLQATLACDWAEADRQALRQFTKERYDWDNIADKTLTVYYKALQ